MARRAGKSSIRFMSFPLTQSPPHFIQRVVEVFAKEEEVIGTQNRRTGLQSDDLLKLLQKDLAKLGFQVEISKKATDKIVRPVFFGENGRPTKTFSVDAFHAEWKCGLEIEAGRAVGGNAIFRDLIQSMVMVDLEHLCLAVPNVYRYKGKETYDYQTTVSIATALYGHARIRMPYGLTVVGY
jgi:hypothetical protein